MKTLKKKLKKSLLHYNKNGPDSVPQFEKSSGSYKCLTIYGILLPDEKETSFTQPCSMRPFPTFYDLFNHLLYHHRIPNLFSCLKCEKLFVGKINLRHHEIHSCGDIKSRHQCVRCSSKFSTWNLLVTHLKSYHNLTFVCPFCQLIFDTQVNDRSSKYFLRKFIFYHSLRHFENVLYRIKVSHDFFQQLLQVHEEQFHRHVRGKTRKSFDCSICTKKLSTKFNLSRHYKQVHKTVPKNEPKKSQIPSTMTKIGSSFFFK